jgi:hypothetical protein
MKSRDRSLAGQAEVQLPQGWIPVSGESAAKLEAELHRELPSSHQLHGRDLEAIGRRAGRDDVLFSSQGGPVFWVHLTWANEKDPQWPRTVTYTDLADFLERWPREEQDDDEGAG